MKAKFFNIGIKILTVVCAIILVESLWVGINHLLKQPDQHFDFGSYMDLFNTLGTLGTLWVAFMAFKKAPEWLSQKLDDHALEIAKDLITKTYPTISFRYREISILISVFYDCSKLIDAQTAYKDLVEELDNLGERLTRIEEHCYNTQLQINSLEKLGWTIKEPVLQEVSRLQSSMANYLSYLKTFNKEMIKIVKESSKQDFFTHDNSVSKLKERLSNMAKHNKSFSDEFAKAFDDFYNVPRIVPDYFDIKSLKVK